jgi:hypothetical protein
MKSDKSKQTPSPQADQPARTGQAPGSAPADPVQAQSGSPPLPPPRTHPACDPHCVDVTGKAPEDIRIDPDITEGHPGYQESGYSELVPPERLAPGQGGAGKSQSG